MATPKQHTTKSRKNRKRMHIFLTAKNLIPCPHCGKPKLPYAVCPNCGYYKGVEVINVLGKLERKEKKRREKEIKEAKKEEGKEKNLTLEELSQKKF